MIADVLRASWVTPPGLAMAALFACGGMACAGIARSGSLTHPECGVWRAATVLLALLALNAALSTDRHAALWLREIAHDHGLYAARRPLQATAVGLIVAGLAFAAARAWRRSKLAAMPLPARAVFLAGPLLVTVAALRAVSHHQTDRWLDARLAGPSAGRWIEVACLAVVLWAAARRWSVVRSRGATGVRSV